MFGIIDGTSVGDLYASREELASAGIHAPLMAGIWGAQEGAYSIVLSGGYEDDIDRLDYILYTGQGGRDPDNGKQVADQEFTKGNRGLQLSYQYNLPVRVTRGHQIPTGPEQGYRFDGLYYIKSVERIRGKSGFYICRFHLVSEDTIESLEDKIGQNFKSAYIRPPRVESTSHRLKRNVKISEKVKQFYEHRCQVCNILLATPLGPIAIGAHIRGLGEPHNGPDIIENMLCLCPNHHDQFDKQAFFIDPENRQIVGLTGFENQEIRINRRHKIGREYLAYQKSLFLRNNDNN